MAEMLIQSETLTAIADKIRVLSGTEEALGLDAMETNLGKEQTNISNAFTAIGNKGGTVPSSKVSGNLASAINSIQAGATVQTKTGSFTTNNSGEATVNCGFRPDIVVFYAPEKNESGYDYTTSVCFEELGDGNEVMELNQKLLYFNAWGTSSGFEVVSAQTFDFSWNWARYSGKTLQYKAIKYT